MDDQLLGEFLAEAEELIEMLFGDIRALRARRAEGRVRRELVGQIFRRVHTIKGTAFAAGLEATGEMAHELESLLDAVRMGRVGVDDPVLDAFDDAVQAIAVSLNDATRGETSNALSPALVGRLRQLASAATAVAPAHHSPADQHAPAETSAAATDADALVVLPEEIAQTLSEYELQRLRETMGEGASVYIVRVDFGIDTFDVEFRRMSASLLRGGEIISTLPGVEASAPERVHFRIVYATTETHAQIVARVAAFGADVLALECGARSHVDDGEAESTRVSPEAVGAANVGGAAGDYAAGEPSGSAESFGGMESFPASASPSNGAAASLTNLVRVPLEELDDIISSTHELFSDTLAALDLARAGGVHAAGEGERAADVRHDELETHAARIRRRFFELEERLIELRMVTVGQTLERAARAGASAARRAGRLVDFETAGGHVRLDKSLADAIADLLLHLLRNAVDHGIEPPAERVGAGKPERGRVRLEAVAEGSRVMLRVSDDGRGIDPQAVTRAAVAEGLFPQGTELTEQQSLRLIFRPGFSTVKELSSMSGRGVGLDAVERAVEQYGGALRVWSRVGVGTTFEMRLPTTLALVPVSMVLSAGCRYCVSAAHVVAEEFVAASDVERAGEGFVVRRNGEVLPLVHMSALLAHRDKTSMGDGGDDSARLPVIISRVATRGLAGEDVRASEAESPTRAAVVVDKLEGRSEALVRSLGRHATRWRGISGATELSDGTVALLLDLPRLLERAIGREQ